MESVIKHSTQVTNESWQVMKHAAGAVKGFPNYIATLIQLNIAVQVERIHCLCAP